MNLDYGGFKNFKKMENVKKQDLTPNIYVEESAVPVPQSHTKELDRRLARHKSRPGKLLSLDELRKRIASRK